MKLIFNIIFLKKRRVFLKIWYVHNFSRLVHGLVAYMYY